MVMIPHVRVAQAVRGKERGVTIVKRLAARARACALRCSSLDATQCLSGLADGIDPDDLHTTENSVGDFERRGRLFSNHMFWSMAL